MILKAGGPSLMEDLTKNDQLVIARNRLWSPTLDRLLRRWKDVISRRQAGHSIQARKFSRRHYIIGVPTTVISAVVSTGILATFRNCSDCDDLKSVRCQIDQWLRLAVGIIGIVAASLTALMTFMNYQESSEKHKNAASDFENLFRVVETLLQVPGTVRGDPVATLHNIREQYNSLVRSAPQLPKKYSVDLTYRFKGPTPPPPSQIVNNSTAPLKKLLEEDSEEIEIDFDLDSAQSAPCNKAAITAAKYAAEKEGEFQKSLSRALDFELQRLERHVRDASSDSESSVDGFIQEASD